MQEHLKYCCTFCKAECFYRASMITHFCKAHEMKKEKAGDRINYLLNWD
jgi:hypothetical protein